MSHSVALAVPSAHLSWEELACHDAVRTPYPLDWRRTRLVVLAREFEAVRAALSDRMHRDVPLIVRSAYRTPGYNAQIGGARESQHVQGRALDVAPRDAWLLDDLYDIVLRRARSDLVIRGIGRYDTFVHMDVRPTTELVRWDDRTTGRQT